MLEWICEFNIKRNIMQVVNEWKDLYLILFLSYSIYKDELLV